jgi:hypothetical protein
MVARCLIALVLMLLAQPALAANCGISGSTSGSLGSYNPFSGGGIGQAGTSLRLTRSVSGNAVTQNVNFILVGPTNAPPGLDIRYQGQNILYGSAAGVALSVGRPPAGSIFYNFGGAGQPDTVSLPLIVTIPPGLDLRAQQSLIFDIVYVCSGTGSLGHVTVPITIPQGLTLNLTVLSALQASYVGAALDFGDIGRVADDQASAHVAGGMLRVASSGPYIVSLSSANGFRMTYPGGNPAAPEQSIRYSLTLLGQTRSAASPFFVAVSCAAAGIAGETLPIAVRLTDGGVGRNPAPDYRDTLTVTVTPTVALSPPAPVRCSGL